MILEDARAAYDDDDDEDSSDGSCDNDNHDEEDGMDEDEMDQGSSNGRRRGRRGGGRRGRAQVGEGVRQMVIELSNNSLEEMEEGMERIKIWIGNWIVNNDNNDHSSGSS